MKFELLLSHFTATCPNTKEWHVLFTCITRVHRLYYKGADFVVIVAKFWDVAHILY